MNLHFTKQWAIDMAERVAGTFVAAFLGALVISTGHVSIAAIQAAAIAGLASVVTVIKSVVGTQIGPSNSASWAPSVGSVAAATAPMGGNPPMPAAVVPEPVHKDPEPMPPEVPAPGL